VPLDVYDATDATSPITDNPGFRPGEAAARSGEYPVRFNATPTSIVRSPSSGPDDGRRLGAELAQNGHEQSFDPLAMSHHADAAGSTIARTPPNPAPITLLPREQGPQSPLPPGPLRSEDREEREATDPVDPGRGEFRYEKVDLALPGLGIDFALKRIYRSGWSYLGGLGHGWTHSYDQRLFIGHRDRTRAQSVVWLTGDGGVLRFVPRNGRRWSSEPASAYRLIELPGGLWQVQHPDGLRTTFDIDGALTTIEDLNGHRLTFSWEVVPDPFPDARARRLAGAIDTVGRQILFQYAGNYLSQVLVASIPASVSYTVDSHGDLFKVTDVDGYTETYAYLADFDDSDSTVPAPELETYCDTLCTRHEGDQTVCGRTRDAAQAACEASCRDPVSCQADCSSCAALCTSSPSAAACSSGTAGCIGTCTPLCRISSAAECALRHSIYGRPDSFYRSCARDCFQVTHGVCDPYFKCSRWTVAGNVQFGVTGNTAPVSASSSSVFVGRTGACIGLRSCESVGLAERFDQAFLTPEQEAVASWLEPGVPYAPAFLDQCDEDCYQCLLWGHDCPGDPGAEDRTCIDDCGAYRLGECQAFVYDKCPEACTFSCNQACSAGCTQTCESSCVSHCSDPSTCGALCGAGRLAYESQCVDSCKSACIHDNTTTPPRFGRPGDLNHNLVEVRNAIGVVVRNTYETDVTKPSFDRVIAHEFGEDTTTFSHYDLKMLSAAPVSAVDRAYVEDAPSAVDLCPETCSRAAASPPAESWIATGPGEYVVIPWAATSVNPRIGSAVLPVSLGAESWYEIDGTGDRGSIRPAITLPPEGIVLELGSGRVVLGAGRDSGAIQVTGVGRSAPASPVSAFNGSWRIQILKTEAGWAVFQASAATLVSLSATDVCRGDFDLAVRGEVGVVHPKAACEGLVDAYELGSYAAGPPGSRMLSQRGARTELLFRLGTASVLGVSDLGRASPCEWGELPSVDPSCVDAAAPAGGPVPAPCGQHWAVRGRGPDGGQVRGPAMTCGIDLPAEPPAFACSDGSPRTLASGAHEQPIRFATVVRSGAGIVWTYYADTAGRTLRIINRSSGASEDRNFDARGRLVGMRQPLGNRTCMTYDDQDNPIRSLSLPAPGHWAAQSEIDRRYRWLPHARLQTIFDPRAPTNPLTELTWDTRGNLTGVSSAGTTQRTTFVIDAKGRTEQIVSASGTITRFTFDDTYGWPLTVTRDHGGPYATTLTLTRDLMGHVKSAQRPGQASVRMTWSKGGFLESREIDGPGVSHLTTVQRDMAGRARKTIGPVTTHELILSRRGLATAIKEYPNNSPATARTHCFSYDARGRLVESVDPEARRVRLIRDSHGEPRLMQRGIWAASPASWDDPCPAPTDEVTPGTETFETIDRNAAGLVTRITHGDTAATPPWTVDYSYDGFGRLIESKLGNGEAIRAGYDARDLPAWSAAYAAGAPPLPGGLVSGEPNTSDMKLLRVWRPTFDSAARLTQTQELWFADSGTTRTFLGPSAGWITATLRYLDDEAAIEATDTLGNVTRTEVDGLGRVARVVLPGGFGAITDSYTDLGRTRTRTVSPAPTPSGSYVERIDRSDFGALVRRFVGEASTAPVEEVRYDKWMRPSRVSTRSEKRRLIYDAFSDLQEVRRVDANGVSRPYERYTRNGRGVPYKFSDGTASTWTWRFDFANRLLRQVDPNDKTTTYAYRAGTEAIRSVEDADHATQTISYDALGGISRISGYRASASPGWTETRVDFTRSVMGVLTAASTNRPSTTADDIVLTARLDSLGSVQEESSNLFPNDPVRYTRDAAGRPTQILVGGQTMARVFDAAGRLVRVDLGGTALATYGYSGLGPATSIVHRNLLQESTLLDDEMRPLSRHVSTGLQPITTLFSDTYTWARDGTLARVDRQVGATLWSDLFLTDAMGRTSAAAYQTSGVPSFSTPSGSVSTTEVRNAINALPTTSRESFVFTQADAWSEKTSRGVTTVPTIGKDHRYTAFGGATAWDQAGHVTGLPDGTTVGYDGLGRTVGITVPGKGTSELLPDAFGRLTQWGEGAGLSAGTLQYAAEAALRERAGTVDRFFVPGLERGPIALVQDGNVYANHYLFGDRLAVSTNGSGAVAERYEYTAHGLPTIRDGAGSVMADIAIGNRLLLTGQPYFAPLRMHRMQHRWYRPEWGAFVSRDPLGLIDGPNPFVYAGAQPIMRIDPWGLDGETNPLRGIFDLPRDPEGGAITPEPDAGSYPSLLMGAGLKLSGVGSDAGLSVFWAGTLGEEAAFNAVGTGLATEALETTLLYRAPQPVIRPLWNYAAKLESPLLRNLIVFSVFYPMSATYAFLAGVSGRGALTLIDPTALHLPAGRTFTRAERPAYDLGRRSIPYVRGFGYALQGAGVIVEATQTSPQVTGADPSVIDLVHVQDRMDRELEYFVLWSLSKLGLWDRPLPPKPWKE
jgi:RHS repeat-associated protein